MDIILIDRIEPVVNIAFAFMLRYQTSLSSVRTMSISDNGDPTLIRVGSQEIQPWYHPMGCRLLHYIMGYTVLMYQGAMILLRNSR